MFRLKLLSGLAAQAGAKSELEALFISVCLFGTRGPYVTLGVELFASHGEDRQQNFGGGGFNGS
jgi:hypothetical protein